MCEYKKEEEEEFDGRIKLEALFPSIRNLVSQEGKFWEKETTKSFPDNIGKTLTGREIEGWERRVGLKLKTLGEGKSEREAKKDRKTFLLRPLSTFWHAFQYLSQPPPLFYFPAKVSEKSALIIFLLFSFSVSCHRLSSPQNRSKKFSSLFAS